MAEMSKKLANLNLNTSKKEHERSLDNMSKGLTERNLNTDRDLAERNLNMIHKNPVEPSPSASKNLLNLINRLIVEKHYDGIPLLLQDEKQCILLQDIYSDVIAVATKNLTDDCFKNNMLLYSCCEFLLKTTVQYTHQQEVLVELLEITETTKSDNTFTSVLKALQVFLLKDERKTRPLEWSLNTIRTYVSNLPIPGLMESGFDEKHERLMEEDDYVRRIITTYITISLFYEPILDGILKSKTKPTFKEVYNSRKNVLACFFLQMLDRPLALLSLRNNVERCMTYAFQCGRTLVRNICKLYSDPFYFLSYVEKRMRWKPVYSKSGKHSSMNIFMEEDKIPIKSLGIFYYLLLKEGLLPTNAPKIYNPTYIFESCLYLVVALLCCKEPNYHTKAIYLAMKIIEQLRSIRISSNSLELQVHANFCNTLTVTITSSDLEINRKLGVTLLKMYIMQFDDKGRFLLLKNLMKTTRSGSLLAYIFTIFKNIVAEQLSLDSETIFEHYTGAEFKDILFEYICKLKSDTETDLMEYSDVIISALNILRYFVIADKKNRTGFWDFIGEIKARFLFPLRKAIDLSRAHFRAEELRVRRASNSAIANKNEYKDILELSGEQVPEITKQHKLDMLAYAMRTFDLIESLLARVNECIDSNK